MNVAPSIPVLSDGLVEENVKNLVRFGVDEFFVDSMQAYSESFTETASKMAGHPDWPEITKIIQNKTKYAEWKTQHRLAWLDAWKKFGRKETLAIWCDHATRVWENMGTGQAMDAKTYGV